MISKSENESENSSNTKSKRGISKFLPFKLAIAACTSLIFIGTFTDAIDKIISFSEKYSLISTSKTQHPSQDTGIEIDGDNLAKPPSDSNLPAAKLKESGNLVKQTAASHPNNLLPDVDLSNKTVGTIRPEIEATIVALSTSTKNDRYSLLANLSPRLPGDLNADEISALLGKETLGDRRILLGLALSKAQKKSLPANEISGIFEEEKGYINTDMVEMLVPYIKTPVNTTDAANLLELFPDSDRLKVVMRLAPLINKPINGTEMDSILGSLSGWQRNQAVLFLTKPQ